MGAVVQKANQAGIATYPVRLERIFGLCQDCFEKGSALVLIILERGCVADLEIADEAVIDTPAAEVFQDFSVSLLALHQQFVVKGCG